VFALLIPRSSTAKSPRSSETSLRARERTRDSGPALGQRTREIQVAATDDPLEHEADRLASIVASSFEAPHIGAAPFRIQRSSESQGRHAHTAPASVARVLAGVGRPLEPALRRDMEPRFGHDFSNIRVYSGEAAEHSARDVRALAYTVGHNIVFGAGQVPTGSPAGRRLLAHELTHTIQQGPHSRTLQRQPVSPTPAPQSPGTLPDAGTLAPDAKPDPAAQTLDQSDPLVETVENAIEPALLTLIASRSQIGKPSILVLKEKWPPIHSWILKPTVGTRIKEWLPDLVVPEIVEQLKVLSKDARNKLANEVFDRLSGAVDSTAPAADVYRKEFDMLDRAVKDLIEPDSDRLAGYLAMRTGLKNTFGSIRALNAFYQALVDADFPTGSSVIGVHSKVHSQMKAALNKTQALLDKKKLTDQVTEFLRANKGYWGTNIRENRNRPSMIGNHSFGFAIDFASDTNPNLPGFPWDLVQRLTGFDAYADNFVNKARFATQADTHSGPADFKTVLESAQTAKQASDAFRDIFDTEANLKEAVLTEARRFKPGVWITKERLFEMVVSPAGKSTAVSTLSAQLSDAMALADDKATHVRQEHAGSGDPHIESPVWETIVAGLYPLVKTHADLTKAMAIVQAQLDDPRDGPGKGDDPKLPFLFEKTVVEQLRRSSLGARRRDLPDKIWASMLVHVRDAETPILARNLLNLHDIFVRSRNSAGKIPSQSTGTVATVAAHGFMNLMPDLVAALTSSEGGGLQWLGLVPRSGGTKDWMHFELRESPKIDRDSRWETDPPLVPDAISGAGALATPKADSSADGGN
jgi:Domain of unknown function (DUF4157)